MNALKKTTASRRLVSTLPVPYALVLDKRITPTACIVYGQLKFDARGRSSCSVFQSTLALKTGFSRQAILRALRALRTCGYISSSRHSAHLPATYSFLS